MVLRFLISILVHNWAAPGQYLNQKIKLVVSDVEHDEQDGEEWGGDNLAIKQNIMVYFVQGGASVEPDSFQGGQEEGLLL